MSQSAQIRQWLGDNPGWHFMSDVCAGLGVSGQSGHRTAKAICRLAALGHVSCAGKHGSKRYSFGREARTYTTPEKPHV